MKVYPISQTFNNPYNNLQAISAYKSYPTLNDKLYADTFEKISFGQKKKIDEYDKKHCKNIINATAAICAGLSAASGEAAVLGVEPWLLRGTQGFMFLYLADCLGAPPTAATSYAAQEYISGAYWGCEGSKWVVAGIGLASEILSGGVATPVATGVVRGVNAGISAAITKKMGNGFIKHVENGTMNDKEQLIRLGTYLGTKLFFKGFDTKHSISDLNDVSVVQSALENAPIVEKELYAQLLSHINSKHLAGNAMMIGSNFVLQFIAVKATAKTKGIPIDNKEIFKQALKNAFVTTVVYDMCDLGEGIFISKDAVDTVIDISENMYNYPEAFKAFEDFQDEVMKNVNLDKINSEEFLSRFKNKTFLFEFSNMTKGKIMEFSKAWNNRKNAKLNKTKNQQTAKAILEKIRQEQAIQDQQKIIDSGKQADINKVQAKSSEIINNLEKANLFGYAKIAGYDEEKGFLKGMLNSLFSMDNCNSEDLPNSILFFGPRENGKTTFASAMAEDLGCRFRKLETCTDKQKALKRLTKEMNKAKEYWETNKRNSIILLDECTAFMTPPQNAQEQKTIQEIAGLMDESAEKYHCTLFLTTNYPLKMDKSLIDSDKISITIPLNPPNNKNAIEVLKHYTGDTKLNYENILTELQSKINETNSQYSNGQLKNIVEMTKLRNNDIINEENLIKTIKETIPEITKTDLDNFEQAKKEMKVSYDSSKH